MARSDWKCRTRGAVVLLVLSILGSSDISDRCSNLRDGLLAVGAHLYEEAMVGLQLATRVAGRFWIRAATLPRYLDRERIGQGGGRLAEVPCADALVFHDLLGRYHIASLARPVTRSGSFLG